MSKGLTLLASCLRKYAQQLPYDAGVWTLYRIVEVRAQWCASEASSLAAAASLVAPEEGGGGGGGAAPAAPAPSRLAASSFTYSSFTNYLSNHSFRRAILRTHSAHPASAPLLMLVAGESMLSRSSFKFALCAYSEVLRMRPAEPVAYLGMGVSELTHAQSRTARSRYAHVTRAALFLARYVQVRSGGGGAEEGGGGRAAGGGSAALAGACQGVLAAPLQLPRALRAAESAYNVGRAAQALGLAPLAMHSYREALRAGGEVQRAPPGASSGELAALAAYGPLDIRREAAYNLVLLLKEAGDYGEALRLTQQHLTY